MTHFDPKIYKKENIKDEKERAVVTGMELVYGTLDDFVKCEGFDLDREIEDGELPMFAKVEKEMLYKIMNDFRNWLESDVKEYITIVIDRETAAEDNND